MSKTVTRYCWVCRKPIEMTDTNSLYKPDGEPYMIFCDTCWHEHMEGAEALDRAKTEAEWKAERRRAS